MKSIQIAVITLVVLLVVDAADARRHYRHRWHRERPKPHPVSIQIEMTRDEPLFPDGSPSIQYPNATGTSILDAAGRTGDWNIKAVTSCL